jgi:hypothetical protein
MQKRYLTYHDDSDVRVFHRGCGFQTRKEIECKEEMSQVTSSVYQLDEVL